MDTLTQALLGATFGQTLFGERLGRRAAWWGAAAGVLPDLDIAVALLGPFEEFRYHRSLTHSLWFGPVAGTVLGCAAWWLSRRRGGPRAAGIAPDRATLASWVGVFVVGIFTHPLLDVFTTYGTQLLWPFSRRRFALDAVAIVDPLYSILLVAALVIGSRSRAHPVVGRWAGAAALALSTGYLFHGLRLNGEAEAEARRQLVAEGLQGTDVRAYPTLFQPWLRRLVARGGDEIRVGYVSMWKPGPVEWRGFTPPRHPLVDAVRSAPEGRLFEWFAAGQTAPRVSETGRKVIVEIEDIRHSFSERPDEGLWGIRAVFDGDGKPMGPIVRFNRPPRQVRGVLAFLWRATFLAEAR